MGKVLLLGAGFVAGPALDYILRREENSVTVACRTLEKAKELAGSRVRTTAMALDVKNSEALLEAVKQHDLVVSLIPYTYHPLVIEAAVTAKKNFVSTSYVSPVMQGFDDRAKEAGVTVLNEIGVDPGIDHLYAMKMIDQVHEEGGKIDEFWSWCGGLADPEAAKVMAGGKPNPLEYKFSWSARGVYLAALNNAAFIEHGKKVAINSPHLLSEGVRQVKIKEFDLEGYPNRDSTPYPERYGIPEAQAVLRGTLRFKGNPAFVKAMVDFGIVNDDPQDYLQADAPPITWNVVMSKILGCEPNEEALRKAVVAKANLSGPDEERILRGLKDLGFFDEVDVPRKSSLLDSMADFLGEKLRYQPGERDMIVMQHKFKIIKADGAKETRTSTMIEYGIPNGATAMARTVGIPCGIAVQLILDGKITQKGVLAPLSKNLYQPIIEALEAEGLGCKEEVVDE